MVSRIVIEGRIECGGGGSSSRPCLDLSGRTAPLWLTGASTGSGLHRANYANPLLSISGTERLKNGSMWKG